MNNNIDNSDIASETLTDGDRDTPTPVVLEITLNDILIQNEERLFADNTSQQLMIKGDAGDKITLSDLLHAGTEMGEWTKARGSVTVDGVQYAVYQHSGMETELLVQVDMQVALDNT
ncbi:MULTISPECIES: Biofilm associated protein A [Enterobacter]|uniref:Biofilm associated protein A n=1 Tax=Enterobacter TaxID=547 RepID=UPI0028E4799D|nr:Biofilm associated protein A [Enterobacter cloacae]WNT37809.1 Biofilm associated protein A [Enterobacter cloacae]HDR2795472.1 Biofilm associated protein A [Enterobacter asburiae]HDR2800853.1 Biofilm associated protein A [Enterobacter asburiae]